MAVLFVSASLFAILSLVIFSFFAGSLISPKVESIKLSFPKVLLILSESGKYQIVLSESINFHWLLCCSVRYLTESIICLQSGFPQHHKKSAVKIEHDTQRAQPARQDCIEQLLQLLVLAGIVMNWPFLIFPTKRQQWLWWITTGSSQGRIFCNTFSLAKCTEADLFESDTVIFKSRSEKFIQPW